MLLYLSSGIGSSGQNMLTQNTKAAIKICYVQKVIASFRITDIDYRYLAVRFVFPDSSKSFHSSIDKEEMLNHADFY